GLGYLAQERKGLRGEKAVVTRMLDKVRVDAGLTGTLQQMWGEWMRMYRAPRMVVASQEIHSHRTFLGELRNGEGQSPEFVWLDSRPQDAKAYLEDSAGEVCYAGREGKRWSVVALDREGNPVAAPQTEPLLQLKERQPF